MAQVLAVGLAEVLRDHDDKIGAAQAWCVRKNIGSIEEAADALTAIGIEVRGYGANLNCQHDDFVGGTIMFCLDADAQLPTDTNSRMRA